jgi:hypothetical protein
LSSKGKFRNENTEALQVNNDAEHPTNLGRERHKAVMMKKLLRPGEVVTFSLILAV